MIDNEALKYKLENFSLRAVDFISYLPFEEVLLFHFDLDSEISSPSLRK